MVSSKLISRNVVTSSDVTYFPSFCISASKHTLCKQMYGKEPVCIYKLVHILHDFEHSSEQLWLI